MAWRLWVPFDYGERHGLDRCRGTGRHRCDVARFRHHADRQPQDSTGAQHSRIRRILARGSARAFTHLYGRDTTTGPSLNYSRGKSIDITLKQARIDRVTVGGRADGVQLEPQPPAPPDTTAKRDST